MYLTRLIFDLRSKEARRDLADAYDMHRTLSRVFLLGGTKQPNRFLWRLERDTKPWVAPTVLVQSSIAGEWGVLGDMPGYLQRPAESKRIDLNRYAQAGVYRFRLMANPTVTRLGKRYGLMKEESQLQWLSRQGVRGGFVIKASMASSSDLLESERKAGVCITVQKVCFDGVLEVQEPDRVRKLVLDGVGPAKAFGCGLLSLARL